METKRTTGMLTVHEGHLCNEQGPFMPLCSPFREGAYEDDAGALANMERLAACWNALEGLDPAAVPGLVAALERCIPWMGRLIAEGAHLDCVAPRDAINALDEAESALAKARQG